MQSLEKKLEAAKAHIERLRDIQAQPPDDSDGQLPLKDPDARAMASSGQRARIVGYNVKAAADVRHDLTVAHQSLGGISPMEFLRDRGHADLSGYA